MASWLASRILDLDFTGTGSTLVDTILANNSRPSTGTITKNGTSWRFFLSGNGTVRWQATDPINENQDYSLVSSFIYHGDSSENKVRTIIGTGGPTFTGMTVHYNASLKRITVDGNNADGSSIKFDIGRAFTSTERIWVALAYEASTKTLRSSLISDHPTTPIDMEGEITEVTTPIDTDMWLANNAGATYTDIEFFDLFAINQFSTIADLDDTVADRRNLLTPTTNNYEFAPQTDVYNIEQPEDYETLNKTLVYDTIEPETYKVVDMTDRYTESFYNE